MHDISRIFNEAINDAYNSLDYDETNKVDELAIQMEQNLLKNFMGGRNIGEKSYREILVKLYIYLTNQKIITKDKKKIIEEIEETPIRIKAYWELEKEDNEWRD